MANRLPDGRFPKGTSGNPGGRPPAKIRRLLREYVEGLDEHGRERAQVLVEEAYRIAVDVTEKAQQRLAAIAWITEQVDGKLPTTVTAEGEGGGIIIRFSDAKPPGEDDE